MNASCSRQRPTSPTTPGQYGDIKTPDVPQFVVTREPKFGPS
jgi:hypothetical protein